MHTKMVRLSIITLNLLLFDGHILLLWIDIICTKNLHHIAYLQRLKVFVAFLYSLSIFLSLKVV